MKNLIDHLHTQELARIRVGIDKNPTDSDCRLCAGQSSAEQRRTIRRDQPRGGSGQGKHDDADQRSHEPLQPQPMNFLLGRLAHNPAVSACTRQEAFLSASSLTVGSADSGSQLCAESKADADHKK